MRPRIPPYVSVVLAGFCGLVAQVLVVREMVVTFHGNELSIGVMLGTWLLWTGLGSLGLGGLARRCRRPRGWFAAALLALALVLLGTVVAARTLKLLVGLSGEQVAAFLGDPLRAAAQVAGFVARPAPALERLAAAREIAVGQVRPFRLMLVSCLCLLGPFCVLNGFLFPLACRALAAVDRAAARGPGRVYVAEAGGAAAGGACYSFVLVHWVEPLLLAFLLAGALCVAAALAAWGTWRRAAGKALCAAAAAGLAALLAAALAGVPLRLGGAIERSYWRPRELVSTGDSRFGRVTIVRPPGGDAQRTLFQNGTLSFSYPDPPAAEAAAHLPLAQHPRPRRVLVLGGGLGGVVAEVLRHPSVQRVSYVELDPLVVDSALRHLPPAATRCLAGPRVEVLRGDARAFLKRSAGRYDVAINAQGPPTTAQGNRTYTLEFFRELAGVLAPGGVAAFRAAGGRNYVREENRRLLACLFHTAGAAFAEVKAFPGARVQFLASNRRGALTYDLGVLQGRLDERGIVAPFGDINAWEAEFREERLVELEAIFAAAPRPRLNRDLAPRCYYFGTQRWSALQRERLPGARRRLIDLGRLLAYLERRPAVAPLAALAVVALAAWGVPLARRRWRDGAVAFAVSSTGLIEMAVQFVVLLGFQVAYGYVYQYVGVLMASFMLGLTAGGWVSTRWVRRGLATWRRLLAVQVCIGAYPVLLLGFLFFATRTALASMPAFAAVSFSLVALTAGVVGGLQFPLATSLHSDGARAAGSLYGLDLFGSCVGAIAVSSVLVPLFGLPAVCVMLAGLAGVGGVALWLVGRAGRGRGPKAG